MPHQCLKCGKIFEEGSTQLLKGCPDCRGNRFFFTKEPLGSQEREKIIKDVGKDINSAIMELMGSENKQIINESGEWVKFKPRDVRKAMEKYLPEKKKKIYTDNKQDIDIITNDVYRKKTIERLELEAKQSDTPETIDIERTGSYKIDLKGLLEEEPIIIQKDGSYTIHLPSLFKMINKEK